MRRHRWSYMTLALALPRTVHAHPAAPPQPHDLWSAWNFAPLVVLSIVAALLLYSHGIRALWGRAGRSRGIPSWRVACFVAGVLAVALALISPIDRVSSALFSVHMVQHLLLIVVAAPLIVLGDPLLPTLWALPIDARRRVGRWWRHARALRSIWHAISQLGPAWILHIVTLWQWHVPTFYDAALRDERVHIVEHTTFFLSALLFWWVVLGRRHRRMRAGAAVLFLFAAGLQSTLFGAALTMARHPWYTGHYGTTAGWGLTPLEDQQLAGLIMWIPAGLAYLAALVPLVVRTLRSSDPEPYRTAAGVSALGTP